MTTRPRARTRHGAPAATFDAELHQLFVESIHDGTNVRTKVDAELKRSIAEFGVLQPITVAPRYGGGFDCLYGHRRLAAARALRLSTIPAIVIDWPAELPLRQLVENQQRKAVDQLDVARTLRAWLDEHPDASQADLATKLGRSTHWVSTRLQLLRMDDELQERVSAGEITVSQAYAAHKATTDQDSQYGRRGRARSLKSRGDGTARVIIELESPKHATSAQATIELDRARRSIELLLEDTEGYGVLVTITPAAAHVLGRRLIQAFQATEAPARATAAA